MVAVCGVPSVIVVDSRTLERITTVARPLACVQQQSDFVQLVTPVWMLRLVRNGLIKCEIGLVVS